MVGVIGSVGSGKSSFLSALLGELTQVSGTTTFYSENNEPVFGYSSQKAWIWPDSLRNNIVFERPWDEARYNRVIKACQLESDIRMLPSGDATIIGERGVNLSGGQRARVCLARAVYSDRSDLYLLDDPLAAVDALVANKLMSEVIGIGKEDALLHGCTRVLVTHHTHFLQNVDQIIILQQGSVLFSGTYKELQDSSIDLSLFISEHDVVGICNF